MSLSLNTGDANATASTQNLNGSAAASKSPAEPGLPSKVLPKDHTARRQSLAVQARRKTLMFEHAAVNKKSVDNTSHAKNVSRRHTIGSNVVFDLAAASIARRTEQALAAISGF